MAQFYQEMQAVKHTSQQYGSKCHSDFRQNLFVITQAPTGEEKLHVRRTDYRSTQFNCY